MARCARLLCVLLLGGGFGATALAAPWAEVGDRELRSDIEVLAAYGLISGPITTWPMPVGFLSALRDEARLDAAPEHVRLAAGRVLSQLGGDRDEGGSSLGASLRLASEPDLVRDFGASARSQLDTRGGFDWQGAHFAARLRAGVQTRFDGSGSKPTADGSSVNLLLGGWQAYAGWVDQWYGPGWTSSLILSSNARPFPKIGLMRNHPDAFETRWLSWLGPWQLNLFGGLLEDGDRVDRNTILASVRLSAMPMRGLEVSLTRLTEMCGRHHSCVPLKGLFNINNNTQQRNITNDEAAIELKYRYDFELLSFSPYLQLMNEDTGPFTHSYESYLGGASWAAPIGDRGARWRLTAEYADTRATLNAFSFGHYAVGTAYNNGDYVDGYRYRGRTLGFSQDSDSTLLSVSLALTDRRGISYRIAYYNSHVSSDALAALQASGNAFRNVVSARPVTVDQIEAGVSLPWRGFVFDFAARRQDRRAYPATGGQGNVEAGVRYGW